MKCLCPLEDRECLGNCSRNERAKHRGARAEQLYQQGFTMAQIATQLGVSQATISSDLRHLSATDKSHAGLAERGKDTLGRKKATGRPKGRRHKPRVGEDRAAALLMLDEGKSRVEAAQATGLRQNVVQLSMERELGRRETFDQLLDAAAVANFSETGKLKIADAIRIHKARLDKQFEQRVNEEVHRRIDAADSAMREENKRLRSENINLQRMVGHRGVFTKSQFRQMQMLCHPDNSASPQLRAALSQILVENENKIVKSD